MPQVKTFSPASVGLFFASALLNNANSPLAAGCEGVVCSVAKHRSEAEPVTARTADD